MSWSYPRPRKPSNPGAAAAAVPTNQLQKINHEWCFVRKSVREESPCCELIIQRLVGKLADSKETKCRRDGKRTERLQGKQGKRWETAGSTLERRAAAAADVDGVIGQLRQELVALGAAHHPYLRRRRRPVLRRRSRRGGALLLAVHAQCRRLGARPQLGRFPLPAR
jgi:hypothetical protein